MPPKRKGGAASGGSDAAKHMMLLGRPGNNVKMGIVGLPNVGKSTMFNCLNQAAAAAAENYPFCTLDPNVAKVPVPDERFDHLVEVFKPKSTVPAVLTVTDIAGLIRGASTGAGLGNAFLSHIAAVDGIFHVVRAFPNKNVVHVDGDVDPVRDLETIHGELRLKDLAAVNGWLEKNERPYKAGVKEIKGKYEFFLRVKEFLEGGEDIRYGTWTGLEVEMLNEQQLLTAKPVIYLANMSEKAYIAKGNKWLPKLAEWLKAKGSEEKMIPFSCEFEEKLQEMGGWQSAEAQAYQEEKKTKSMMPRIIRTGFRTLKLSNFFTAGADEVRAWTVRAGSTAPQCAGVIHTDFEKGFIAADTMSYTDFVEHGDSETQVKLAGKLRSEGRKYIMNDGDIFHFKFNVGKGK